MSTDKPTISTVENIGKKVVGRPKGSPKTGGRKKGVKNQRSIILHEILANSGVDIGAEIKKAFDYATPDQKILLIKIVLEYFPKPNPVEMKKEEPPVRELTPAQKSAKLGAV